MLLSDSGLCHVVLILSFVGKTSENPHFDRSCTVNESLPYYQEIRYNRWFYGITYGITPYGNKPCNYGITLRYTTQLTVNTKIIR